MIKAKPVADMRVIKPTLILLLATAAGLPAISVAAPDTATELRLRSIEARLPDADKLAELERKVNQLEAANGGAVAGATAGSGGGSFALLQQVQSLQDEVRQLRGEIEQLKHETKQREQGQRELYQNLDSRLQALEGKRGSGNVEDGAANGGPDGSGSGASENANNNAPVDEQAAEEAYNAAFNLLKQGKYSESVTGFNDFVKKYNGSKYTDNAWYWLGEAHYVNREYKQSLQAFRTVLKDYKNSPKAPGAMYKVGVIQDEQGNTEAAQSTLAKVIRTYPDDNAAELARKRLKAIGGDGTGN